VGLRVSIRRGYDHTCKSMWRCDNVGSLGEHVTCHTFQFLSRSYIFVFFQFRLAPSPHRWTDFDDRKTYFRARKCLSGVAMRQFPYYRNYTASIPTKFCIVMKITKCPSRVVRTRITNPRWRTATIVEKSKNHHIS